MNGVLRARRIVCAEAGLHLELPELADFVFWDYSWQCKACGRRHCSTCTYVLVEDTVMVYDCGGLIDIS